MAELTKEQIEGWRFEVLNRFACFDASSCRVTREQLDSVFDMALHSLRSPAEPVAWLQCGGLWGGEIEDLEIDADQKVCERMNIESNGHSKRIPLYAAPLSLHAATVERCAKVLEQRAKNVGDRRAQIELLGQAAAIRQLAPSEPGMVMVPPREPTYEMVQAGAKVVKDNLPYHTGTKAKAIWTAMYDNWLAAQERREG